VVKPYFYKRRKTRLINSFEDGKRPRPLETETPAKESGMKFPEMVERYDQIQGEIKSLESEKEQLKAEIIEKMVSAGRKEVKTSKHKVTIQSQELREVVYESVVKELTPETIQKMSTPSLTLMRKVLTKDEFEKVTTVKDTIKKLKVEKR
jgi:hypothetical protein